jgi:hypothetical protein
MRADKFTYISFSKVQAFGGQYALAPMGVSSIYVFQNTKSEEVAIISGSDLISAKFYTNRKGGFVAKVLEECIVGGVLSEFNRVASEQMNTQYLFNLVVSALYGDTTDFVDSHHEKIEFIEGDDEVLNNEVISKFDGCEGILVITKEGLKIDLDESKKLLSISGKKYSDLLESIVELDGGHPTAAILTTKKPKMNTKKSNKKSTVSPIISADKVTFINICQVTHEDGWGGSIEGVATPIYIFENSETGAQIGFSRSQDGEVLATYSPYAEIVDFYIQGSALKQFNELTGKDVESNYMNELIRGAINKDAGDFEYENGVETLLLEGEEHINDESLEEVKGCFGVWVLSKDFMDIKFDEKNKSLLINDQEMYQNFEELFDELFGNSEQVALLIKD